MTSQATTAKYPAPIDLVSSSDPHHWTSVVDLSEHLPSSVREYNAKNPGSRITLLGKCEFQNPGASHKDRIAKRILGNAEKQGLLRTKEGGKKTILVASSGNTGCSIAWIAAAMGYAVTIITTAKCSDEKRNHIRRTGATLWMAETLGEMFPEIIGEEKNYMKQESLLAEAYPDRYFAVNQYDNRENTEAHACGTGPEIFKQTNGNVSHFVMAASTGGTIMGVGGYLKKQLPHVSVILADPDKSNLAGLIMRRKDEDAGDKLLKQIESKISAEGKTLVEGAGKAALTEIMKNFGSSVLEVVDRAVRVRDFDAFDMCRHLAQAGVMVGGSSGVNVSAANIVAEECLAAGKIPSGGITIVTLLCDHGIKYLSKIFNDKWYEAMKSRNAGY